MILEGSFYTDCAFQEDNYCKGLMKVTIDGDAFDKEVHTGTVQVTYASDSKFRPPAIVPNPLPAITIRAVKKKGTDGEYTIEMTPSIFRPFEFIFAMVGMEVDIRVDRSNDTVQGVYRIRGGFGVPRDEGVVKGRLRYQ
jgi:hypothetical protein